MRYINNRGFEMYKPRACEFTPFWVLLLSKVKYGFESLNLHGMQHKFKKEVKITLRFVQPFSAFHLYIIIRSQVWLSARVLQIFMCWLMTLMYWLQGTNSGIVYCELGDLVRVYVDTTSSGTFRMVGSNESAFSGFLLSEEPSRQ